MTELINQLLQTNIEWITLEQFKRCMALAFFCDIPLAIWGAPGIGKSSVVYWFAARTGYKLYDFRLSDKEAQDIGGVPYPIIPTPHDIPGESAEDTVRRVKPYIEYLIARGLLPFDSDEKCILFLDEVDRTFDPAVKNAIQQVILDRRVNGHILSKNCRIVIAGNGTSDIDTSPLSKAANGRMIHCYVENVSLEAKASWLAWANEQVAIDPSDPDKGTMPRASSMLQAFAKFNHEVWINGHQKKEMTELDATAAQATNRTWIYADRILRASEQVDFKTSDILPAMIAGCVGKSAGALLLEFRDTHMNTPSIEAILADPEHVALPDKHRPDLYFALTLSLCTQASKDKMTGEAVAIYGLRWPGEFSRPLFNELINAQPHVAMSDAYREWLKRSGQASGTLTPANNHIPELMKLFPNATVRPESNNWANRLAIPSDDPVRAAKNEPYILCQNRHHHYWACSCPAWINRHSTLGWQPACKHTKRIPESMIPTGTPTHPDHIKGD